MTRAHDRGMHEGDAALGHHFAHVTVAELVGDVPADGLNDEQTVKVAACEERWQVRGKLGHATDYLTLQRLHQSHRRERASQAAWLVVACAVARRHLSSGVRRLRFCHMGV